jgi:PAS domain S-box-containing protein
MKISTRLRLANFIPAIMALAIIVALIFSYQNMAEIQKTGDRVRQIRSSITELNHFVFSYILYHEERPKQQFLAAHDDLMQLLASTHVNTPDQQRLLESIRQENDNMESLFSQLVSNFASSNTAGAQELQEVEDRLVGLILLNSYGADTDAATLRSLVDNGIRVNGTGTIGLISLILVLATIPFTIVLVRTRRGIISSISSLSKGAAVIGSGNLDFTIDEKRNDEIGELTHAFNQMTSNLKTVTATKSDLEKEIDERKRIQSELESVSMQHQLALDAAQMGWWHYDPVTKISYWDERFKEIFHITENEKPIDDILASRLYPDDLPEVLTKVKAALDPVNPQVFLAEYRMNLDDGSIRWIEAHGIATFEGTGKDKHAISFVGTVADITGRKKAEEALRETRDYLDNLFNYANAPIIVWNPNFEITRFNHAFERLTGRISSEVIGKKLDILFPGDSREESMDFIRKTAIGERWDVVEIPIVNRNGTVRVVLWNSAILYSFDGKTVTIAQGQDITERKTAEDALQKMNEELEKRVRLRTQEVSNERQRLYDVLETLPVYVVLLDKDYHVPFANRFFRERFGESHGKRCYEYLFNRTESCENCESYKAMKTGALHHWEWYGPDGKDYDIYDYPFRDIDGSLMIMEMGIDISEQKRAREALLKAQDELELRVKERTSELEASNKELEAFSYSVSHDLRAPLRSMEGFSSALLEDYADKLGEQGKQYLKYVQESSDLMGHLIDDLLKLSRVTRSEMNYETVNLSDMAQKTMAELQKTDPDRKVKLDIPPDITAYGDRNLLRLVLENMLGNAWKFSSKTESPVIEIGVTMHHGKQAYFVHDNGVGFDMAYADKLFQPFQRLHKASEFAGTGIGLATVQRIIRRHGGEVWAESKVGEGATFYFTLS